MSAVLDGVGLVDHHCHGVLLEDLDRSAFEAALTEADEPGPWHGSLFDTQAGLGVRAVCAPLLDLPRFAPAEDYLARRRELGVDEVNRRLLAATGIGHYLVDTGFLAGRLTAPDALAAYTAAQGHEIVRVEAEAERLVTEVEPRRFADAARERLGERSAGAVGFKSIAAYRVGLDLDPARPSDAEVAAAAARWVDGDVTRLTDRTIVRFLIWTAVDLRRPLQFHVGYGDRDVDMARCDPLLLMPLLRATADTGARIMLLHNYPFQRHAGYLAQVFDHVFVDVGLATHNVGTRADTVLAELLELAPFGSVLFSSDAFGLPELYALDTVLFRHALGAFLDDGVARAFWSAGDAERIAAMIAADNARRAYELPG